MMILSNMLYFKILSLVPSSLIVDYLLIDERRGISRRRTDPIRQQSCFLVLLGVPQRDGKGPIVK